MTRGLNRNHNRILKNVFKSAATAATARPGALQTFYRTMVARGMREDLALYVLDGQFRDLKTGRIARRVPRAEREMFYRQLFGVGNAQVTDGMRVNREFARLWAVLMTEVARYISKVEESPNATGLVSKQRVLQAIEDLQYNLSAHCVGMTKVAAPVICTVSVFMMMLPAATFNTPSGVNELGSRGSADDRAAGEIVVRQNSNAPTLRRVRRCDMFLLPRFTQRYRTRSVEATRIQPSSPATGKKHGNTPN